jgi:hypothetical protein
MQYGDLTFKVDQGTRLEQPSGSVPVTTIYGQMEPNYQEIFGEYLNFDEFHNFDNLNNLGSLDDLNNIEENSR